MAVSGPNGEGFANTAAALCPTFSPAMDAGDAAAARERTRGQVAVISQSGGMGFAFFDHGRPKDLSFRYIVTTGNEACLAASDFAEFIVDEKTDAILMLIEDIKNVATFARRRQGAARRAADRQPARRLGGRRARDRGAHGGARRRRRIPRAVRALRRDREQRPRRDGRYRGRLREHGQAASGGQARRDLLVLGRRRRPGRMPARSPASTCRCSTPRRAPRSTRTCRPMAARRTRSTSRRRPFTSAAMRSSRASRRIAERRRRHPGGHRPPSALPAGGPRSPDRARPR